MALVRVLLVDDDEAVLAGLQIILEAHEFGVTTASNVLDALRLITTQTFDVLISDLHMPGPGDGLILVGAMRHANPTAVILVLSANPDLSRASGALVQDADQVLVKPPKGPEIVAAIVERLGRNERVPHQRGVESIGSLLERERRSICDVWLAKMREAPHFSAIPLGEDERRVHACEALTSVLYRLRYPQPLGMMTLFSMAALQHGATRRRQGFSSPALVEEARALQVAVFQTIQKNLENIDLGQLPATLMAIADEINAQLLQSISGYEKEEPGEFADDPEWGSGRR